MPDSAAQPSSSRDDDATRTLGEQEEAHRLEPRVPERLGRYEVRRVLGQGGMGTVYAAHDPKLRRDVALKVLRRVGMPALDDEGRQALLHEARAAAAISHPHVVTIYDVGELDGELYVAMELVEGPSLRDAMQAQGPGSPQVATVEAWLAPRRSLPLAPAPPAP